MWWWGYTSHREERSSTGIDAVIDKDLASERLATLIGATKLILLTDVDGVYDNYGKSNQQAYFKDKTQ